MKAAAIFLCFAAALFAEWVIKRAFGLAVPISAFAVFFWFWTLDLPSRVWAGLFFGFLLDVFSPFFGTNLVVFFFAGFLGELLQASFISIKTFGRRLLGAGILLFFYLASAPLVSAMLYFEGGGLSPLFNGYSGRYALGVIAWPIILPLLFYLPGYVIKKIR